MFGSLKKKLRESVDRLAGRAVPEEADEEQKAGTRRAGKAVPIERETDGLQRLDTAVSPKGKLARIREGITRRELTGKDIDDFFRESETELLQANVALEVVDFMRESLREKLSGRQASRGRTGEFVRGAFRESLLEIVDQGRVDLSGLIRKKDGPALLVFLGFNGSGKTTSIAKVAEYLKARGHRPVLAAADTFRAASIEQLEHHGERLGLRVIKHQYGADSAAVVFDAVKYAKSRGNDVVLADTAGRSHADRNLMDELSKVIRVNRPDLRILVVDSLTGNDAVEQAKRFDEAAGVDAVIMTKADVNEKGGSILSVCYAIKKPVLFLGTGQEYRDLEGFVPDRFVKELLG
jgi:fused signal recognition particle receptor